MLLNGKCLSPDTCKRIVDGKKFVAQILATIYYYVFDNDVKKWLFLHKHRDLRCYILKTKKNE